MWTFFGVTLPEWAWGVIICLAGVAALVFYGSVLWYGFMKRM